MKKIFNFLAAAALCASLFSCEVISEDAFSTDPVAPEFYSHADILMTTNTMSENVSFSWSAYRYLSDGLMYTLSMTYDTRTVDVATTGDLFWTCSKSDFMNLLYASFPSLPVNDTFSVSFTVSVNDGGKVYESSPMSLDIYAYGDMVAPEISLATPDLELAPENGASSCVLITWTDARLVYGESVLYDVFITANAAVTKADEAIDYQVAEALKTNSLTLTVDAFNDAISAAGGIENDFNAITFKVKAYCDSFADGITAASAETMSVKTYVTTFPELLYLPGSHQGWAPATAPTLSLSKSIKGYYAGVVDLTTEDGSDVEFKFCVQPDWGGDYGGVMTMEQHGEGDDAYWGGYGEVGVSDNIKVPSGVYAIALNKKFGTLTMVGLKSLSMIGAACGDFGWGQDVDLEWDKTKNVFSAKTTLKPGEYKFRFNHDWTFSIGKNSDGIVIGGDNISNDLAEGEYKVSIDLSAAPYKVSVITTAYPEQVYIPGSMNGWGFDHQTIAGNGEGVYEAFRHLGGEWGFKITETASWDNQWGSDGTAAVDNGDGSRTWQLTSKDGGNIMEGVSDEGYYKFSFDYNSSTVTLTPVTTVGLIGSFPGNSWSSDYASMVYDSAADKWIAEDVEIRSGCEWKFRMNEGWDINLGGDLEDLVQDGDNIVESKGGIYDVELYVNTTPYRAVLTWKGEPGAAVYKKQVTLAGDYTGASWSIDDDPKLSGADGFYSGALTMYNPTYGFKVVHNGEWISGLLEDGSQYIFRLGEGDNMMLPNGSYFWNIDIASEQKSATATPITLVGLIGSFNGWGEDLEMTFDEATLTYKAEGVQLAAGDEVKVRFNSNWDYNLGMDDEKLVPGGSNMVIDEEGLYTVELSLKGAGSTISFVNTSASEPEWSVIGAFNDWNADAHMTQVVPGVWVSDEALPAGAGEWKLRYDGGWDVNMGGGALSAPGEFMQAVPSGDNMSIEGSYKVVYNSVSGTIGTLGWGVTGSIASVGISWDKDIPMNLGADGKWYSYPVQYTTSDEIKIREFGGWDNNRGGSCTAVGEAFDVTGGGDNFKVPADGVYMIVYDPVNETITVSTEFWGVVGDFNGWGNDEFMMPGGDGKWYAFCKSYTGGWKIRKEAAWNVDRGGNYSSETPTFDVVQGGPNIDLGDLKDVGIVYDSVAETISIISTITGAAVIVLK